jgi:hypothetical protein
VLHPRKEHKLEVIENEYMTYRAVVQGMDSPVKLSFEYGRIRPRLNLYVSFDEKEPRKGSCLQEFFI